MLKTNVVSFRSQTLFPSLVACLLLVCHVSAARAQNAEDRNTFSDPMAPTNESRPWPPSSELKGFHK